MQPTTACPRPSARAVAVRDPGNGQPSLAPEPVVLDRICRGYGRAENIALPLRLDGRRVRKDAVARLGAAAGISAQFGRLPHTLSGGQQQRAAIARVLVTSPASSSPTSRRQRSTWSRPKASSAPLRQAASDPRRAAVVIVTHDPFVASQADRVLVLGASRIVTDLAAPDAATIGDRLRRRGAGDPHHKPF
jgi:putative ABC transport system ATP-binding protein